MRKISNFKFLIFNSRLGFTLIEIMIGITIMSVLFVGGFTTYREFLRRQVLSTATLELKANLAATREKAISAERPTVGECGTKFLGYIMIFTANSYTVRPDCDVSDPGVLSSYYLTYTLASTVTISVTGTPVANQILFVPLAGGTDITSANGATITLTESTSGNSQTITVYPTGAIK